MRLISTYNEIFDQDGQMRRIGLYLMMAAVLAGCAPKGTIVERADGVDFSRLRHVGVVSFEDPRKQGSAIAEGVANGLKSLNFVISDKATLDKLIADYSPGQDLGLSLEQLVQIRTQTSTEAIIFGKMAPDWSEATVIMVETELGDMVLRASVRPDKKEKAFANADEIVKQTLAIFDRSSSLRSGRKDSKY